MIQFRTFVKHTALLSVLALGCVPFSVAGAESTVARTDTIDITALETAEKKDLVIQDINSYILEVYKAQGDKILRNLDITLRKTLPKAEDQIQAYSRLQAALIENRKQLKDEEMSETRRTLISDFLLYLIEQLDVRIHDLS